MKNCWLIALITLVTQLHARAQTFSDNVDKLKSLLSAAEKMSPAEAWNIPEGENDTASYESPDINTQIMQALVTVLNAQEMSNYDPDTLLLHEFLSIAHSQDRRLWDIGWYENTGGTFTSYSNVIFYMSQRHRPIILDWFTSAGDQREQAEHRCYYGSGLSWIYNLNSDSGLYLGVGGGKGCSTCCYDFVNLLRVVGDSVLVDYPAFEFPENFFGSLQNDKVTWDTVDSSLDDGQRLSACFYLSSRCGNVHAFDYDPLTHTLTYDYVPDDLTPVSTEDYGDDAHAVHFRGRFVFDGVRFRHQP